MCHSILSKSGIVLTVASEERESKSHSKHRLFPRPITLPNNVGFSLGQIAPVCNNKHVEKGKEFTICVWSLHIK